MEFFPSRTIALSVGAFQVHWYGIMYAVAFILGMSLLPRLERITRLSLTPRTRESLFLSIFLGVLLGGRIGFVLFYGGDYFVANPLKVFAVWEGGMASHGGFIGVALALYLFCRRTNSDLLRLTDTIIVPVALGLALGRVGNFINGELYGAVTSVPWGMNFPGVEGLRHPTQLYAIMKDLVLALASLIALRAYYKYEPPKAGLPTALFLMLYSVLRFTVEIFRDQPYGYTNFIGFELSRGQILTVPLFIFAVAMFFLISRRRSS